MNRFLLPFSSSCFLKASSLPRRSRAGSWAGVSLLQGVCSVLFLATAPPVQAQTAKPEPGADNPVEKRIGELREKLKLTDDQVAKLRESFREQAPELRKIREDNALSAEQKREKLREILKANFEKLAPLLTPEQKAAFASVRAHGADSGKAPEGPLLLRIEALKERLNLTEVQRDKISPILKDAMGKLRTLREESDASGRREKAREILESARTQIATELTAEQKQQFREWAQENRPPGTPGAPK